MALLETLTVELGTAVATLVLKLWLKDASLAQDILTSFVDSLADRLPNLLERRKVARQFERIAEDIAERLAPYFEAEYQGLPANEREAAASAVAATLAATSIDESTLLGANLNARALERYVRSHSGRVADAWLLGEAGSRLYDFALRESCDYIVEIASNLPGFTSKALQESLRREDEILRLVRSVLDKLPASSGPGSGQGGEAAFETRYRREVARKLDRLELFGVTVSDASRRYGLSVAYITLTASGPAALRPFLSDLTVEGLHLSSSAISTAEQSDALRSSLARTLVPGPSGLISESVIFTDADETYAYETNTLPGPVTLRRESESGTSARQLQLAELLAELGTSGTVLHLAGHGRVEEAPAARVDETLASWPRTLIRGEAGSGKTTLLQWLAICSARRSFNGALASWNDSVPFFIQLRRYASRDLPAPEAFLEHTARTIAAEMPAGWVHQQLASGRALLLVDGLDELPEGARKKAREWLGDLTGAFPTARYVVTSRPPAASGGWLRDQTFSEAELQPMSLPDIEALIDHWHAAAREGADDEEERAELSRLASRLKHTMRDNRPIRNLAASPLLCALLCALNRDRRTQLPKDRVELYRIALEMLLERRDIERDVPMLPGVELSLPQKQLLLQDLAFWLLLNNRSDAERADAVARIGRKLPSMPGVHVDAEMVFNHLLVRSGLLREPVEGRVDFVHRTFQEYLGAKEAVEEDHIGLLLKQARSDQWREVVVLAAGLGNRTQRESLIGGLLEAGRAHPRLKHRLHFLAVACLEAAPALSASLTNEIRQALSELIPPRTMGAARAVASARELAVPLLAGHRANAKTMAACVRALGSIGTEECLDVLRDYASSDKITVVRELVRAWASFEPEEFAGRVLADAPLERGRLVLDDPTLLPGVPLLRQLTELHCRFDAKLDDLHRLDVADKLVSLDLQGTVADLAPLERHRTLRALSLRHCPVDDLEPLAELTALEDLRLAGCSKVADLRPLRGLKQLRNLNLTGTDVEDLSPLTELDQLEELSLASEKVATVAPLGALRRLRLLALIGSSRIADLSALQQLHALTTLWLVNLPLVNDLEPLSCLHGLHKLLLRDLPQVHDLTPLATMTGLRSLQLQGLVVANIRALGALTGLKQLVLSGLPAMSDLAPVGELTNLRLLRIRRIRRLTDLTPLGKLQYLESLMLEACPEIVDLTPLHDLASMKLLTLGSHHPDLDLSAVPAGVKIQESRFLSIPHPIPT